MIGRAKFVGLAAVVWLCFPLILSASERGIKDKLQVDPRGGRVLRIAGFDLRKAGVKWGRGRSFKCEAGADGVFYYALNRSCNSENSICLVPNRSYIISVLLAADFERPCEVNMGLRTYDGGGKNVIDNLNGLPNKTGGWQRWEWEFTADHRATSGRFIANFYRFGQESILKVADIAFVELLAKELKRYGKGEGATFRGGPGRLPMRVEETKAEGDKVEVRTTGALYSFDLGSDRITAKQMLEREREIFVWKSSLSLKGLEIVKRNSKECVLANDNVTFGVQCDSLMMVVPHDELIMSCTSRIGGKWNRFACSHMFVVDDYGGFAVNPDIPLGTGRLARVDSGIRSGRRLPGQMDFGGIVDHRTFISSAKPGWSVNWNVSPGERLGISVFPPRPFPWRDSFRSHWRLTHRRTPVSRYAQWSQNTDIALLWNFLQRGWGMSWEGKFAAYDDEQLREHISAIKKAGMRPIIYISPYFYYSRDAEKFASEAQRLKDTYGLEGAYYDGIPSQEWIAAYEEMRMTREVFPDGILLVHNTGHASNGGPPLGEPSLKIPAVETYADITYGGELVYGYGKDWAYPKYVISQYGKSNCVGTMKYDKWEGLSVLQKDLMMLLYGGRSGGKSSTDKRYFSIMGKLEKLWEEKGSEPDFYEKYYVPRVKELTKGLLPE